MRKSLSPAILASSASAALLQAAAQTPPAGGDQATTPRPDNSPGDTDHEAMKPDTPAVGLEAHVIDSTPTQAAQVGEGRAPSIDPTSAAAITKACAAAGFAAPPVVEAALAADAAIDTDPPADFGAAN